MKQYSCYLFDADGTLIDTMDLIYQSYMHTLSLFNHPGVSEERILKSVGIPLRTVLDEFLGKKNDEEYAEIFRLHNEYQISIATGKLKLFPGVMRVLQTLKDKGNQCVVVTSRSKPSLFSYFKMLGIYDFFDFYVTPDMTEKHKPEPEPVLKALELCKARPDKALLIGDTIHDMECASRAGVDTCFVNWSRTPLDKPGIKPTYCIDRMEDILVL